MKKTILAAVAVCAACTVTSFAQDVIADINTVAGWRNGSIISGPADAVLSFKMPGMFQAKGLIKIKPDAKYAFSGEIRKNPNAPTARCYPGFMLYDKDKKIIDGTSVSVVRGTDTTMAKAAKAGDTFIMIKNGARWRAQYNHFAALNAGPLPHRELSSVIKEVKRTGNMWRVTFAKPLTKAYPAGTKVRIQAQGAYFYVDSFNPTENWKKFGTQTINGVSKDRVEKNKFWPGTVYARPFVQANWNWGAKDKAKFQTGLKNLKAGLVK